MTAPRATAARELVVDFFDGPNAYGSTAPGLQKHFDVYALARAPLVPPSTG